MLRGLRKKANKPLKGVVLRSPCSNTRRLEREGAHHGRGDFLEGDLGDQVAFGLLCRDLRPRKPNGECVRWWIYARCVSRVSPWTSPT